MGYNKFLHRQLPEGVTDIETVLYHRDINAIPQMPTFASVNYVSDDEDEDEDNDGPPPLLHGSDSSDDEDENQANKTVRSNNKVMRSMKKLSGTSYNPLPGRVLQAGTYRPTRSSSTLGRNRNVREFANLVTDFQGMNKEISEIGQKYKEPKNFQEAWNHPDPIQRKLWREAITKEYTDMDNHSVWVKTKRSQIPKNRRCVKCKWVFKIKRDGKFRARLVACGYSQIPGVDFTENYSPVIHDISARILIIIMIIFGLQGKLVDVETAFLYGDLEEEVYMDCPEGMVDVKEDEALLLQSTIYGLVQSARQYYKIYRETEKGKVYFGLYVDDNLLIGDPPAIQEAIQDLKEKGLVLKIDDNLNDYLSWDIRFSDEKDRAWIGQPHLIANLQDKFGEKVNKLRKYVTPGTPSLSIVRNPLQEVSISKDDHKLYRSGVGMLLYLVKYSRPDIANPVRELSKVLDSPTPASFKEMLRVIKYVLDTKEYGLRVHPTVAKDECWELVCFCDSDYAGDPDSRRSVTGYVLYVKGVPVCWKSKAQRSVTLSSTEAEWIALSEAVKEIIFVLQLLESLKIEVNLPITVRVDNTGAIFMAKNINTTSGTKHVDVRTKYVNEYCEDGVIKIIFVESANNDADIFTKNLGQELHNKHSNKLISTKNQAV